MAYRPPGCAVRLVRRLALGATLGLLVLAAAHGLWWLVLSARLEEGLAQWADARRAEGWSVAWQTPAREGWPRAAALRVPDLRIAGGAAWVPGGVAWDTPEVTLRLDLLAPGALRIEPAGTQRFRVGGSATEIVPDRLAITLPLASGAPGSSGALEAAALDGVVPGAGPLRATELRATWGIRPGPAAALDARADAVVLPQSLLPGPGLDGTLRNVTIALTLGAAGLDLADPQRLVARWQEAGGTLTVRELGLDWGGARLTASATLGLDPSLRPEGAATARVAGAAAILRTLLEARLITPRAAGIASAALPLMTRRGADGRTWTELPLTLRDGVLALGRFPLARLPDPVIRLPR